MQNACLVIGEALVDEVIEPNGRQERIFGGSPANTALAVSRLGLKSYFKARISKDSTGQQIKDYLTKAAVDLSTAIETEDKALVIKALIQADGSAQYSADLSGCADFGWQEYELSLEIPSEVAVVHLGSLTAATMPGAAAVEQWIKEIKLKQIAAISFDPNIRPNLVQDAPRLRQRIESIASLSDVVKVSHEDLYWFNPDKSPEDIAMHWLDLGAKLVIITQAENGAMLVSPNSAPTHYSALSVNLIDTIGAGDTFAAALLTQLIEAKLISKVGIVSDIPISTWKQIINNSLSASAITCSRKGANPPYRSELDW